MTVVATAAGTSASVTLLASWLGGHPPPQEPIGVHEPRLEPVALKLMDGPGLVAVHMPQPAWAEPPVRAATERDAPSRVVIVTEPEGARVTIDGVGWGTTPLTVRYLTPGAKRVRVTKPGYHSEERVVLLEMDRPAPTVRIALREDPLRREAQ